MRRSRGHERQGETAPRAHPSFSRRTAGTVRRNCAVSSSQTDGPSVDSGVNRRGHLLQRCFCRHMGGRLPPSHRSGSATRKVREATSAGPCPHAIRFPGGGARSHSRRPWSRSDSRRVEKHRQAPSTRPSAGRAGCRTFRAESLRSRPASVRRKSASKAPKSGQGDEGARIHATEWAPGLRPTSRLRRTFPACGEGFGAKCPTADAPRCAAQD